MIRRFVRRIAVFSFAFMLITPFAPLASFDAQGYESQQVDIIALSQTDPEAALLNFATEDGFLYKPSVANGESNRIGLQPFAYTVNPGDTVSSIAGKFGVSKETLLANNPSLTNANNLRSGMILSVLPVDGVAHVVKKGDTVQKIATTYKAEASKILAQNQLAEGDTLAVDTLLIVPGGKKEAPPKPVYASIPRASGGNSAPSTPPSYPVPSGGGRLIFPAPGASITQYYRAGHLALDIANPNKVAILAAEAGTVITAKTGWNGGYGNYIVLDHGNGLQTLYGHNETLYVKEGDQVAKGQSIAWMGNTGRVYGRTGIHVHFEVRDNGVKKNPLSYFK